MNNALQVEKELVSHMRFPANEVLETLKEKVDRKLTLKRASVLGNIDHTKMKILFKDNEGLKKVHTTVWGVTKKYVILKGASLIPLHRIVDVY